MVVLAHSTLFVCVLQILLLVGGFLNTVYAIVSQVFV